MLHRMLASRALMSLTGVAVVLTTVAAAYFVAFDTAKKTESYCAIMPDAIGLYTGNHVTMLGIPVGTVTAITADGTDVRVDFVVDADHPVAADASATTVSTTLVADRALAVLGTAESDRDPTQCITTTLTPKSLTQTLSALQKLAGELTGNGEPGRQLDIGAGTRALDTAVTGTGPEINDLITTLAAALNSPDAAIGHIGALIDALSSLAASVSTGWGDIKSMLTRFATVLEVANDQILGPARNLFDGLRRVLEMFNDITTLYGEPILSVLGATVPAVRWIGANVGTLQQILEMAPPILTAFRHSADPTTGATTLSVAPPRVAVPTADAQTACAAINALTPGQCTDAAGGLVHLQLVPLVLGLVGPR